MNIYELPQGELRIIEEARKILEQRECDEALMFAEQNEIKPSLHNIVYFGAYLDGARAMLKRLRDDTHGKINLSGCKGKECEIYDTAFLELISIDKNHMNMYLDNRYEVRFRNHVRDAKGKLKSVEAYFVKTI